MTVKVAITLDADWATYEQLKLTHELLEHFAIKATWFATNRDTEIDSLFSHPLYEVGVHPNFYSGGDVEGSQQDILKYYLSLFPGVRVSRSHGLFSNGRLMAQLASAGVTLDSSLFLPDNIDINPYALHCDSGKLWRMPFSWADDHFLTQPKGERVTPAEWVLRHKHRVCLLFHPVHIYVNSDSIEDYQAFRQTGTKSPEGAEGIKKQFENLLMLNAQEDIEFVWISELIE